MSSSDRTSSPKLANPPVANPPVVQEEEALLAQVHDALSRASHLATPKRQAVAVGSVAAAEQARRADAELVALRDEIGEARLEDVPALIAQMERLQGVSLRRSEAQGMLVNPDAPYFAHLRLREEDERGKHRDRDVLIGRSTFIDAANGVRIVDWRHAPLSQLYYRYSEGSDYEETFGEREAEGEILVRRTVTIEGGRLRRVAAPQGVWARDDSGWQRSDPTFVQLEGGEGKAARPRGTLGGTAAGAGQRLDRHLPEIAALIDPRQFEIITAPQSGVVVIQGGAGSGKTTIGLHRIAYLTFAHPRAFRPERMLVVTFGPGLAAYIEQVLPSLGVENVKAMTFADWASREIRLCVPWLEASLVLEPPPLLTRVKSHPALLHALETRARAHKGKRTSRAVVELWGELLTDETALAEILLADPHPPCTADELVEARRLMGEAVFAVIERGKKPRKAPRRKKTPDDDDIRGDVGIDGVSTDDRKAELDLEDMAMILRVNQLVRGAGKPLDHLFVDEAQDLSPLALATLIGHTPAPGTSGKGRLPSVTLAGDTAQRLFLDNGFADWRSVLGHLSLSHVAVEPLRVAYRSTRQVWELAHFAMGPLAEKEPPLAPRSGAPVEMHTFPAIGAAVAFLAEALRPLCTREPRATVGLLARHTEQIDRYYDGLSRSEIPGLRRVRGQDFSFKPGIEMAEIRDVKGLEFDYVVLLDVNASAFGTDAESRHLLHIGATRAAHQLWLIVTGTPSALIPPALRATAR